MISAVFGTVGVLVAAVVLALIYRNRLYSQSKPSLSQTWAPRHLQSRKDDGTDADRGLVEGDGAGKPAMPENTARIATTTTTCVANQAFLQITTDSTPSPVADGGDLNDLPICAAYASAEGCQWGTGCFFRHPTAASDAGGAGDRSRNGHGPDGINSADATGGGEAAAVTHLLSAAAAVPALNVAETEA